MKKRNIELTIETAERWYNGCDRELKELAVQTFPELEKKRLPKSWYDLKEIVGYYTNSDSEVVACMKSNGAYANGPNKNVFATKKEAKASVALAQLSQLREVYRNGWVPDWKDGSEFKYSIFFMGNKIIEETLTTASVFLTFQDSETRDLFLENFRDLIEKAKPLMQ